MNSFFAYIFTAMTLFGSFSSAESFCADVKSQNTALELSASEVTLVSADQGFPSSHEESDCHHSCVGHNCHLGHCAFPMSSQISVFTVSFEMPHHIFDVALFIFDFQTSLFRPPIS